MNAQAFGIYLLTYDARHEEIGDAPCGKPFIRLLLRLDEVVRAAPSTVGQTPVRESDKQRLAFRTEADTEGWRAGLLWQVSERDDIRPWGGDAMSLVPIYRGPHGKGEELCH
jgi:hypothetical protein